MSIAIKEVTTRRELRDFIKFPHWLFRNDPLYVPALDFDERHTLTSSPILDYSEIKMWLAYKDGKIAGRIACIINNRYNELYDRKRARFGWWDVINDYDVAESLFDKACDWARSMGMTRIHGPLGLNTMGKQGLVVYGFDAQPQSSNLYNPEYYKEFVERYGFEKELDWVQYKLNASQGVPEKLHRLSDMLMEKHNLKYLDIKSLKASSPTVRDFFYKFNEAFSTVENFIPFTDKEIAKMAKFYIKIIDPKYSCIVVDDSGEIATFAVCIPSLAEAYKKAKGKVFPFGWFHIIKALKGKCETIDLMMLGASEKWNSKGVSAIFHSYLATSFKNNRIRYAITNPQIETNNALNVWDRYSEKELYIRRRCYIKDL